MYMQDDNYKTDESSKIPIHADCERNIEWAREWMKENVHNQYLVHENNYLKEEFKANATQEKFKTRAHEYARCCRVFFSGDAEKKAAGI